jgi:hypothetical protein
MDARLKLVELSPGIVVITRPGRASGGTVATEKPVGIASCACSDRGTCFVKTVEVPDDPSKLVLACGSGTCAGTCTLSTIKWPGGATLGRSILAAVERRTGAR